MFIVASGNQTLFGSLSEILGPGNQLILGSAFIVLATVVNLLLQCLAWPRLFKTIVTVLLLITALSSYFMDSFGVLIDKHMIRSMMETDALEVRGLITPRLVFHLALYGLLPSLVVTMTRLRHGPWGTQLRRALTIISGTVLLSVASAWPFYQQLAFAVGEHRELKLMVTPLAPISILVRQLRDDAAQQGPPLPAAPDAHRVPAAEDEPSTLFVFVLGETATASHFSLNGYERRTNPALEKQGVVSFDAVSACGTSTAVAVPCIFSPSGRSNYDRDHADRSENLLDILQRLDIDVLWRDNNSGSKGVSARVPFERTDGLARPDQRTEAGIYDEALLNDFEGLLDQHDGDFFLVLHQAGSHGPAYFERTPPAFKLFVPECTSAGLLDCETENIVNAYDNTILYTDHVLAQLIDRLAQVEQSRRVAMLYVSDHGESLGRDGIFLHGLPYWLAPVEQTNVPMIFWANDAFLADQGTSLPLLEQVSGRAFSHDNVFHTVLGAFGVLSAAYDNSRDLFAVSRPTDDVAAALSVQPEDSTH